MIDINNFDGGTYIVSLQTYRNMLKVNGKCMKWGYDCTKDLPSDDETFLILSEHDDTVLGIFPWRLIAEKFQAGFYLQYLKAVNDEV